MQKYIRLITLSVVSLMAFPTLMGTALKERKNKNELCNSDTQECNNTHENATPSEQLVRSAVECDQPEYTENQMQEKMCTKSSLNDYPVETDNQEFTALQKPDQMAAEDIADLISSMVVLVDVDFKRRMIVLDVDVYRDDPQKMDSLLIRYANDPEQAEKMLTGVAQQYMTEHGDELLYSVLRNCNIADAEMLTYMLRPVLQRTLLNEFLRAMHRCIVFKSHKLSEVIAH